MFDPFGLKKGNVYSISKETPLMPEFEPKKPAEAIKKVILIPPGFYVKILGIKYKRYYPWYKVLVKSLGIKGWINSLALLGQTLKEVTNE